MKLTIAEAWPPKGVKIALAPESPDTCQCADCPVLYGGECPTSVLNERNKGV